ncbi:MAG: TauD/TfdA family dioxygenase [Alphaproteobacteria bacterium]|nr:TauD/TfdA family dioxygenase [Alphaproteobacteria bacterium]
MTLLTRNTDTEAWPAADVFSGPAAIPSLTAPVSESAYVFEVSSLVREQADEAIERIQRNGLGLNDVEQEDIRLPALVDDVPKLLSRLDEGPGFVIVRGLGFDSFDESACEIVTWGVGNYFGRPVRQGLRKDRRLFTVTNHRGAYQDPTRIGATTALSHPHTDNGCLEPRPPDYVLLACYRQAKSGGESTIISSYALHEAFARSRPDLLPLLYRPFHFLPPKLHTWPGGPATIVKPIFEKIEHTLHVHYARVMVEPGMALAGTPLSSDQIAALDLLDQLLVDPKLVTTCRMRAGDALLNNNCSTLHGRLAYEDDPDSPRNLKRLWLWQRHRGPGTDPLALDRMEFSL